ncbi:MAG: ABC transporter permease subunit [Candidatus Zixiibacteriota bacterium]
MMLKVIIEKEIRDLLRSTKFAITFGACAILIIITFYVGITRYKLNQSQYEASIAETKRSLEGVVDWNEIDETSIFLPPTPLASLVSGISNDIGRTSYIRGRGEIKTEDSRYNEDPIFAIFRFIDLEFIFQIILSLFAILLGYDAVSGEKERGTLRLSLANSVPRQTYIAGKLIGSFISLMVAILLAVLVGLFLMPIMGVRLSGDEWMRLSMIVLTGLLYFGVFLTLSIFISSLTHRSSNSFLILLIIWVFCIHIVPRLSIILAGRSVDVPTIDEMTYQKSILSRQLRKEFMEGMDNFYSGTDFAAQDAIGKLNHYVDSLNEVRDTKMQKLASRLAEERHNYQKLQEKLSFSIARLSPATSFSLATSRLAGTSLELKNHYYEEALSYQQEFAKLMTEKTGFNSGGFLSIRASSSCSSGEEETPEQPMAIDPNELPGFSYRDINIGEAVNASLFDIGFLFIFNLFFFAGAFIAFNRYDAR